MGQPKREATSETDAPAAWVRFGCSSFSSDDWVGPFYPDGTRPADFLSLYAGHFDTVEVDATYYAVPRAQMVDGWNAKTPDGFLLSAKFPRTIVHAGQGPQPDGSVVLQPHATYDERDRFLEVMSRLGDKLGTLVLQFPYFSRAAFEGPKPFLERLDRFLDDLPAHFRYAVEVRNRGWVGPDLAHLCRRHKVAMVLVDQAWMPHGDEVEGAFDPVTSDHQYVRLLGDRREIEAITQNWDVEVIDRRERLERWASFLVRSVRKNVPTLVYVNNHYAGHAPTTARRLQEMFENALAAPR